MIKNTHNNNTINNILVIYSYINERIKNYENIFFFQTLIPSYDLLKLRGRNLMWAPMYDNLPFDWKYWKKIKYTNIKLLCFSKKVKLHVDKLGCRNIGLKYFFRPKEIKFKNAPQ